MVRFIIGLDFGTTYSGVAYTEVSDKGGSSEIMLMTAWPGRGGAGNAEKIPSRISYGPPPQVEMKWGNLIRPNDKAKVHSLMKLKLDKDPAKNKMLRRLLILLSNDINIGNLNLDPDSDEEDEGPPDYPGKDPVDMVADYLGEIREHCEVEWKKQYGDAIFATLDKEIVVTVPAVWKESAKDATIQAVKKAGFVTAAGTGDSKIRMVTEPEAAAIFCLKEMTEGAQKDDVKVGDAFVLCDAGGGTVDLISYKVTQTYPTFRIEEAAVGSGAKCGATFVEEEFLKWLQKWIGPAAFGKIPREKMMHGSKLINEFETAKMDFSGVEDGNPVTLPRECGISDDEALGIDDQILSLSKEQMKAVMDPCVNRTLELVDGQVASLIQNGHSKPKMVIVVGGFGRNNYLFNRISEYCQERGILTRRPKAPWSAVVRGAVCRGLEGIQGGLVAVRLSRKHYGTYASEPYRAGFHHPDDLYTDELTGTKYAKAQMTWLVDKGERLPESYPKKVSLCVSRSFKKGESREIGGVLVGCDEDKPPQRYKDDAAYNICRVSADLNSFPDSKFARTRSGITGEEYFVAELKLEATFSGGDITWKIIFDRQDHGSATVSYDK